MEFSQEDTQNGFRFQMNGTDRMKLNTTGMTLQNGTNVNEFSIDGTLAGNSDDAIPTEKAVKTYVDGLVSSPIWTQSGGNVYLSSTPTDKLQVDSIGEYTATNGI